MAKRKYAHTLTITGRGEFPLDMLRYDNVYPLTSEDASTIRQTLDRSLPRGHWVCRVTRMAELHWNATEARWESFGTRVREHEIDRAVFE